MIRQRPGRKPLPIYGDVSRSATGSTSATIASNRWSSSFSAPGARPGYRRRPERKANLDVVETLCAILDQEQAARRLRRQLSRADHLRQGRPGWRSPLRHRCHAPGARAGLEAGGNLRDRHPQTVRLVPGQPGLGGQCTSGAYQSGVVALLNRILLRQPTARSAGSCSAPWRHWANCWSATAGAPISLDPEGPARLVRAERPQFIVNAGASTAVDKAESDADNARLIKCLRRRRYWPRRAKSLAAPGWCIATDYVFDGAAARLLQDAPTGPLSACCTLEGEQAIRAGMLAT